MKPVHWINTLAFVGLSFNKFSAAAPPSGIRATNKDLPHHQNQTLREDKIGTFLVSEIEYGRGVHDDKPRETINIELDDGLIYTLANVQPSWAKSGKGKLKSGEAKIKIGIGAVISGATIDLRGGAPDVVGAERQGNGHR